MQSLAERRPESAAVIGAGYTGPEMAEAVTTRGIEVTQIEALPEILPTVDRELGALVRDELISQGVEVITGTQVSTITRASSDDVLHVRATGPDGRAFTRGTGLVLGPGVG
ncbi:MULTISPECIES: NAD-binding protein [unclassified Streptomyces]|uniref:FAD-dependent oxidoreductase n=1 Tax=unclassified Streptomyces TaxID=2593676 RepID=UPI0019D3002C|nr:MULTISPECIES: NAD-binding protein [unclassified Streptomyces]